MGFEVIKDGPTVRVRIENWLVANNRQELKQIVLERLEQGERRFVIDFVDAGYIDSSGLGLLVSLSKKLGDERAELKLANLNADLRTLLELTQLVKLFDIVDDRDGGAGRAVPLPPTPRVPLQGAADLESPRLDDEAHP